MGIVDFILDNLYLVIILVGFLVSVLGKGARNPNKDQTQGDSAPVPRRAPSTTTGPVRRPPVPTTRPQSSQPPAQAPRRQPQAIPVSVATEGQPQQRQQTALAQQAERDRILAVEQKDGGEAATRVNRPSRTVSIHADKAVEGMMWAEVFGPPRARRGHSSRYPSTRGRR